MQTGEGEAWQVGDVITQYILHMATSSATETEYDAGGNIVRTTDGNGHVRTQERDRRGLVLKETDAEGAETTYTYDLNDNPVGMEYGVGPQ